MTTRPISIANRHPSLRLNRRSVIHAIRVLDAEFARDASPRSAAARRVAPPGELSLVFLTDAALAGLHRDFLADPTVTDVITFEGDPLLGTAGEICVSVDAALRQGGSSSGRRSTRQSAIPGGGQRARTPAAFATELTLYLVHGWLHLAGYDDLQPARKRVMRRAEARAMTLLRNRNCLPAFALL